MSTLPDISRRGVLGLTVGASALGAFGTAETARAKTPAQDATNAMDRAIERMILIVDRASKNPAGRLGGLILRGYAAYRQYKTAREVGALKKEFGELRSTVYAMLADIVRIIEQIEAGAEVTETAFAAVAEQLDNHAARLTGIERDIERLHADIARVERKADDAKAKVDVVEDLIRRRANKPFHKYDRASGRYIDVRDLPPHTE